MKKYKGNKPLAVIKRAVLKAGGRWDQSQLANHPDAERIITERDSHLDGVEWYDAVLDLLYEPFEEKERAG